MKLFRKCLILFIVGVFLITAAGCSSDMQTPASFEANDKKGTATSYIAAENSNYQLKWDSEKKRILLVDKTDSSVWSTLPQELIEPRLDEDGDEIRNNPRLENPITVEYINTDKMQVEYLYGYTGSLQKNDYKLKKLDNGFEITYYFTKNEISVTVSYTLLDDGMRVEIDPNRITEGKDIVYRIAVSPFFCSAKNADDAYLFVPSGSGALIYTADKKSEVSIMYSQPVYGEDKQVYDTTVNAINNTENIKLPVFGAKNGNSAVTGIISDGADSAYIECNIGNVQYGYSSAYAVFAVRGKTVSKKYSDAVVDSILAVNYYPLKGEKADYSGMAECYKKYLTQNSSYKRNSEEKLLSVEILGATHIEKQFFGVPYKKLYKLTTINEAQSIIDDLKELTGDISVLLRGFGKSGLDYGKVAGGGGISGSLGSVKKLNELSSFCENSGIDLYFDFNVIDYASSGNGISKINGYAVSPTGQRALPREFEFGTGSEKVTGTYLVKRSKLKEVISNLADVTDKWSVSGISLGNAANTEYSDYSERKYFVNGGFSTDYTAGAVSLKEAGKKIQAANANAYAALCADLVIDAPVTSNMNDVFNVDIPFYQMVFKGYVPMTSKSVNLCGNSDMQLLRAAESGIGLNYTVVKNFDTVLNTANQNIFYNVSYKDNIEDIKNKVQKYKTYFEEIKGAAILSHKLVSEQVRATTFDNGVTVIVNYGEETADTEYGTVAPNSFIWTKAVS